jgi:CRP/FNR family transcriptional regulator
LRRSVLAALPADVVGRLLAGAMRLEVPAGSVLYREGDPVRCGLVVSGLLRMYLEAPDGRQVTMRYLRPGNLPGVALLFLGGAPPRMAANVQALTGVVGLMLDGAALAALARDDARVAWALGAEVARSQQELAAAYAASVFGTVAQRVARHVLDLSAAHQAHQRAEPAWPRAGSPGERLMAAVTQQALADAVASTRVVVTRALHDLRVAGLIETTRGGVLVLDAERLHAVAAGEAEP